MRSKPSSGSPTAGRSAWPPRRIGSLIDLALERAGIAGRFRVTLSSEEVGRGKPAPDVYLEAARRLGVDPARCAAVEDSHNGILAARAAGMRVVAVPNASFPPGDEALAAADVVLPRWPSSCRARSSPAACRDPNTVEGSSSAPAIASGA